MEAAGGGFKEIVTALRLHPNTTIDKTDDTGNTALHYAAFHGQLAVVMELLKGDAARDIQNAYGHTAASYAAANKFKGVVDALNRPAPRSQRMAKEAENKEKQEEEKKAIDLQKALKEHLEKIKNFKKDDETHVKGPAEDLHKKEDFAPKFEDFSSKISEKEQRALEEQLSKLRRAHDEAELKSQKKIVDLLEKSADQERAIERVKEQQRAHEVNSSGGSEAPQGDPSA